MDNYKLDDSIDVYSNEQSKYYFDNKVMLTWYANRIIERFSNKCSVLDLGLGHGFTANAFSEYFSNYLILDGSKKVLDEYKRKYINSKAELYEVYFENFQSTRKFDLIIMGFILEHVKDPMLILKKYREYIADNSCAMGGGNLNGSVLVAVPNAKSMNRRLGNYMGLLDNMYKLSDYDLQLGHLRYYDMESLSELAIKAGYKIKNIEGIYLKPFTTSQIDSLNLDKKVFDSLCKLGVEYPELSNAILMELTI